MKPCKICNTPTEVVFNINLDATPICEDCAQRIFLQQAMWYVKEGDVQKAKKILKTRKKDE